MEAATAVFSQRHLQRAAGLIRGFILVFVTVGNATQGFRRLLEAVDRLAVQGIFKGDTLWVQSGSNSDLALSYGRHCPFLTMEDFVAKIHEANLIIAHAGAGTLFHVFQAGKIPVVMPRRKKYGELVDDHQMELVQVLAQEGRVIPAYEPDDLPQAIAQVDAHGLLRKPEASSPVNDLVAEAIAELVAPRGRSYR